MRTLTRIATGLAVAAMAALLGTSTATAAPPPAPAGDVSVQTLEWDFFTDTVAAGGTRSYWYKAPQSATYAVGLSPKGASTTQDCEFEVTRTWNVQQFGGERKFWFTVKNVGAIACGTDVMLYSLPNIAGPWHTNGVDPGGTVTKHWNHASVSSAYVASVAPSGATSSAPCQFEVVREWYEQQPNGEREFWFTLKNTGTIACSGEVLLGHQSTSTTLSTHSHAPGASSGAVWFNNPDQVAYLIGFNPNASSTMPCKFELTRAWHAQAINDGGVAKKELRYNFRNAGSITCSATRLIASVT